MTDGTDLIEVTDAGITRREQSDLPTPFPLAAMLVHGRVDARTVTEGLGEEAVLALADRVEMNVSPTLNSAFPARRGFDAGEVQAGALRAVNDYLSPLDGGPDRTGWPFGRPVSDFELSGVLAKVRGVELVEEVILFPADPRTGRRGEPVARLQVAPDALVFSYQPQVKVDPGT